MRRVTLVGARALCLGTAGTSAASYTIAVTEMVFGSTSAVTVP